MTVASPTPAESPMPLAEPIRALRVLIIGESAYTDTGAAALKGAGHTIVTVQSTEAAVELLLVQSFDAILLTPQLPASAVEEFSAAVRQLNLRTEGQTRATVLFLVGPNDTLLENSIEQALREGTIDGVVEESLDPDALTLAIARLASVVALDKAKAATALGPALPVLDVQELKEQVGFDDELLCELIDLYIAERAKQSPQMQAALAAGNYESLSRITHTIKGSLASLHALAARAVAQSLESAAHTGRREECPDLLAELEQQLDRLDKTLLALRRSLS